MKAPLSFIAASLLAISAGCGLQEKPAQIALTYLGDLTEDTITSVRALSAEHVETSIGIADNPNQGYTIRFKSISDSRYTPTYSAILKSQSELSSNDFKRSEERQQFHRRIEEGIAKMQDGARTRNQSFVIHGIANALNDLSRNPSNGAKVLVILSDLGEHTPSFSVFNKKDMKMLTKHPEEFIKKIDQEYPITDPLDGTTIFFVHSSGKDDQRYDAMVRTLSDYYSQKGALTEIVGSIEEVTITTQ